MKRIWLIALGIGFQSTLWANLVVNGDFETPVLTLAQRIDTYFGGDSFMGWTVGGHSIEIVREWVPASGLQCVDLNGQGQGSISQNLTTVANQIYYLSFAMAAHPYAPTQVMMEFYLGDDTTSLVGTLSFDPNRGNGYPVGNLGWTYYEFPFRAMAGSATLTFSSLVPESVYGPGIDDVVVSDSPGRVYPSIPPFEPPTVVPEPSTYLTGALLLLPFGLQGVRRLRSWKAAV